MVVYHMFILLCLVFTFVDSSSLISIDQRTWKAFNQSISGRLFDGRPMLTPCFDSYNGHQQVQNSTKCTELRQESSSDYFGGYQNINWATCQSTGESCTISSFTVADNLNSTRQCLPGSVPTKYVDIRSVDDVQKSLAFIRENGLQLVIKNTGHDYLGRSSGSNALALWTHNYQPPIRLERNFIPEGCTESVGNVVTFGAGQQFHGIYEFASQHNIRIVGGTGLTVGASGGWITGGGHSILSNELGLGIDNVYQMRAILPNGTLITATRCQNTELFFALRGGGGSTFGIVMETSILAHQERPMEMISLTLGNEEQHVAESFIQTMVNNAERWAHEGWGGFFQPGMYKSQPIIVIMATSMLDHLQARASMKPILEFAHQFGASTSLNMTTFPTFGKFMENISKLDSMSLNNDQIPVSMSSRIIPRHNFQERSGRDKLTRALNDIMLTSESNINSSASIPAVLVCLTTPFKYSKHLPELDQKGRPGYSSVTPAWRDGLWHVVHKRTWGDDETPSGVANIWKKTSHAMDPMRNLTPGGGAYQNEADAFEPDSVTAFWGQENYDRLLKIKREVDPENIFTGHQGVGWDRQNPRYDCYPR